MEHLEQRKFRVVQTQEGVRTDLGDMTETEVYAHMRTRLLYDMAAAESALGELEQKGIFRARFDGGLVQIDMEIRRL